MFVLKRRLWIYGALALSRHPMRAEAKFVPSAL